MPAPARSSAAAPAAAEAAADVDKSAAASRRRAAPKSVLALDDNLSYRLSMLGFMLGKATAEIYGAEQLTAHQWKVISVLCHFAPLRASQIERLVTLDKSAISRTLQSLLSQGLIERRPAAVDGRAVDIWPSQKGHQLHLRVARRTMALQVSLFDKIPAADLQTLFDTLRRLEERLRERFA